MSKSKRQKGQFYTTTNPFGHVAFKEWLSLIPKEALESQWLEPFAGANNILSLLADLEVKENKAAQWACYDLDPPSQSGSTQSVNVVKQDTLANFPSGFDVVITNPPYLAKNSATRRSLEYPSISYDDVYKYALETVLSNVKWAALIIPESFITCREIHLRERLWGVVSLTCKMFEDTEAPVCLAMFVENPVKDTKVWNTLYKTAKSMSVLESHALEKQSDIEWKFNDPKGEVGLYACDSTSGESIRFVLGSTIDSKLIKGTSRSITRISCKSEKFTLKELSDVIIIANRMLTDWRAKTGDVFLTSFKGLRKDGRYRRRLDWRNASSLLESATFEMKKGNQNGC